MEDNKTKHGWDKVMSHDMDEKIDNIIVINFYIEDTWSCE
jgi:hypothetical protein